MAHRTETQIHFAGVNTTMLAAATEGRDILISYADVIRRPGWWANEMLPRLKAGAYRSVVLDSGAFTEITTPGFHVSVEEYAAFVTEHGNLFDQIVTLDDIGGDLARTWRNTATLLETGAEIVPVFHGREPLAVLAHYCEKFGRVGLGFARDFGRIAADQGDGLTPDEWLSQALDICETAGVEIHGFGMTRYAMNKGHARLTTTDSTTWIAEYRALCKRGLEGSHGVAGELAEMVPSSKAGLVALTLRSYEAQGTGSSEMVETLSKGQARTVLRRFGSAVMWALEEARLNVNANLDSMRVVSGGYSAVVIPSEAR